jgi:hypothetical protein
VNPDAIVVINYPGHCISTVATLNRIYKLTQWECPTYIIIDDYSEQYQQWPTYEEDLRTLLDLNFPDKEINFLHFSKIDLSDFEDGWYRQQFVKLYLDEFIKEHLMFVVDEDVILDQIPDRDVVPWAKFTMDDDELFQRMSDNYKQFMLGIDDARIMVNGEWRFTHHAPVRWLTRRDTGLLRMYVQGKHNQLFMKLHKDLVEQERVVPGIGHDHSAMIMTEWDLIEAWRLYIDKQDLRFEHWPPYPIDEQVDQNNNAIPKTIIRTFYGTDKDIPVKWLEEERLTIPKNILDKTQSLERTEIYDIDSDLNSKRFE